MNLGFTERFLQEATLYPDLFLGRVVSQHKNLYKVATEKAEFLAEISGKLRYTSDEMSDYPAVGDFVMLDRIDDAAGNAIIHHILRRKSVFVRRAAGKAHDVQVIAANIDTVFICMSLNQDFNLRRLERYLAIAWDSGATPVIVLTKSDLCHDSKEESDLTDGTDYSIRPYHASQPGLAERTADIERIAAGVDVIITSGMTGDGTAALLKYITPGRTVAFIGSSGVGKSTMINRILGEGLIKTQEIRKDDKGRHTTTSRELIPVPSGGAVIDTPGMRELGVESVNLGKTFIDIDDLAKECRFKDCKHEREPGCAVRKAMEEGLLDEARLENFKKLQKEARYEGMNSKQIEKEKMDAMFSGFGGVKNAREFIKSKNKRG